jgi:hypothetical protein
MFMPSVLFRVSFIHAAWSHLKGHSCDKPENAAAVGNHVHEGTTLDMIFSVTYYLELHNVVSICCIYLIVYQHMLNWLYGHYRALTTLLGKFTSEKKIWHFVIPNNK